MHKEIKGLVWLTQLGLSVAGPLFVFIYGAVWLRDRYGMGVWVLILGIVFGFAGAVDGLRYSLKAMGLGSSSKKEDKPPTAFNDHE